MHAPTDPPVDDSATGPGGPHSAAAASPVAEPRQRWRLTFRRGPVAADLVGRVAIEAWQTTLEESGLALAQLDTAGRPRVAFGAPLSAAAEGEAELAEIFLAERIPAWRVREALADRLPSGYELIATEDIWLGAPALPGRVVAADWRVELRPSRTDPDALAAAAQRLLAAPALPRTRSKGGADKVYDLRPLLEDVRVAAGPAAPQAITLLIRTRFRPELGSGRPEEVVAAIAEECGTPLVVLRTVRERLILA